MEFLRDLARVTHTYEFINAVAYLREQYPQHKTTKLTEMLNTEYYRKERQSVTITELDVALADCIIQRRMPVWPEGELFYSVFYNAPYVRSDFPELNKRNYKLIVLLAKKMRIYVDYRINAVASLRSALAKIDTEVHVGSDRTLAYWKDKRGDIYTQVINTVRNLILDSRDFKRFWTAPIWYIEKDDQYSLPLLVKKIDVSGKPNAVKVYVRTRYHKLCICTRNSYLLMGV